MQHSSDTPQPPSRRWTVYRFDVENGLQYVGITQRAARFREAEHISGDRRLTGGSARISDEAVVEAVRAAKDELEFGE